MKNPAGEIISTPGFKWCDANPPLKQHPRQLENGNCLGKRQCGGGSFWSGFNRGHYRRDFRDSWLIYSGRGYSRVIESREPCQILRMTTDSSVILNRIRYLYLSLPNSSSRISVPTCDDSSARAQRSGCISNVPSLAINCETHRPPASVACCW